MAAESRTAVNPDLTEAMDRGRRHSPFLKLQLDSHPDVAAALADRDLENALAAARSKGDEKGDLAAALRRERSATALALGIADLAGLLSLEELTVRLSDLADRLLEKAVAGAIAERSPEAEPRGFALVALGKHGSRELNYSSDLDLLFLYDPATLPRTAREEPQQAAIRIGQRLVELLQKRDANGYAFRIDLRLRPSPEATPIALPVDAAIGYYESSALPWERAAFIRARAAAGDKDVGRAFLASIHPFVWRRSLDFGAIAEIQSITGRIRDHYAQGQAFGPGYDLKRGRGGIREIEFFAQIHQLIHGGREPELRAPATLHALAALAAAGRIAADEGADLAAAYRLLRTVEHRLQMVDDRQTHSLPADPEALDNVACLHGLQSGAELLERLRPPIERTGALYDQLAGGGAARVPADPVALDRWLAEAGFSQPAVARQRIEGWRSAKARALRTPAAQEAFESMLPALLRSFGAAPAAMDAMNRFDDIVAKLPSGVNFFRLLDARPMLTDILAAVLGHAPALADALARRPALLDGLIDASAFDPPGSVDQLAAEFRREERSGEDYQQVLDRVRRKVNERRFALGVQLVVGSSDPIDIAAGYGRVAEAAIGVLADAAVAEFQEVHGRVPGSELVILGLGRLGGMELTHASDLDLVYLFTGTHEAESDGRKPLRATDYFNRLAPRVTAALSVPTASGPLYDVDTRLRPSGQDGLLAVSLPSYADYLRERAWTWEHMALTRARPVYGSPAAREQLQQVIDSILRIERDPATLTEHAVHMRGEMAAHKPAGGKFDIKLGSGGLVDLEFAVQVLQLRDRIGLTPHLADALTELAAAGLVEPATVEAQRLLTRMLVTLRLVSPSSEEPPAASRELVARACRMEDWNGLLAAHDEARQRIGRLWDVVAASKEG
jgi:glutamate-ammonia-ligase adenylyltransferase